MKKNNRAERCMTIAEEVIRSSVEMRKFCQECTSDKKMDALFERTEEIEGGHVTVMVEVKSVPVKKADRLADTINQINSEFCYHTVLEQAKEVIEEDL